MRRMVIPRDAYSTLGVPPTASNDDIKHAYRRLARTWHPDVNNDPAAEAKFKKISEAYAWLGDPDKRREYDDFVSLCGSGGFHRTRHRVRRAARPQPPPGVFRPDPPLQSRLKYLDDARDRFMLIMGMIFLAILTGLGLAIWQAIGDVMHWMASH
jgi:curved DNA-binding protein CbpA